MKKLLILALIMIISLAVSGTVLALEDETSLSVDSEISLAGGDEGTDDKEEQPLTVDEITHNVVSLDGKTVMMVGNSMLYYGNCVITGNQGKNDEGYFYQLVARSGERATVLDYTYGGKKLDYIYSNHLKKISEAELAKVDYVVLAEANQENNDLVGTYKNIRALFPEKTEFIFMCHPMMYYNNISSLLGGAEALRKEDIFIVDWGRMVTDIFSGSVSVPGATQSFNFCSFIKDNTTVKDTKGNIVANPSGDNKHPNPLSGYICAQMVYSAITNRSSLYTDYTFCYDTDINSCFNIDAFALKHYTGNKTTNFTDIFRSPSDMFGLQRVIDTYLEKEGKHLITVSPSVDPTCTSGGLTQGHYCSVCGETVLEQEYIQSIGGHTAVYTKAVAPKCTKDGKSGGAICSVCGEVLIKPSVLKATGHSDTVVIKPATTVKDGRKTVSCMVCYVTISDVKIPKITDISLSKTVYNYDGKAKKPKVTVKGSDGKLLEVDKDYTVTYPSGRTAIGNYTVTVEFKGRYSGKRNLTFKIRAGAPSVTVKSYTDSAKLSWKKVEGATGYRIFLYNTKTKKYEEYASTKKTTLTVKKLKAATKYKFRVKAYTDVGKKRYHAENVTNLTVATSPLKAELLSASYIRKGEVTLKWKKVKGADGYRILYSTDSKMKSTEKLTVGGENTLTATTKNLKAGKIYYFKVRAYKSFGGSKVYGEFSKVKSAYVKK